MGKAVTYYLLGGFKIEDFIREPTPEWKRPDLVDPPSLLQYDYKCIDGLHIYTNSMGCSICLYEYGTFSKEEMLSDYNSSSAESIYSKRYSSLVSIINNYYKTNLQDIDWVTTLCSDNFFVGDSHVSIAMPLLEENCEFVACIDSSIIYQSVLRIGSFFKQLSTKKSLTKYEQHKISYFIQEMNILSSPNVFLTNSREKEITQVFYDAWHIEQEIHIIQTIANQAVSIFSFVSNYRKNNEPNYSAMLMSYLSFLLLYDSIGNLFTFLVPIDSAYVDVLLKLLIGSITLLYVTKILKHLISDAKDKRILKKKTK
ncbi:MAG: hypothetical protein E7448_02745 [Ruminococcaceae bacterium]|nr:hypothetical protein [Oscillospiraceae bacterium]